MNFKKLTAGLSALTLTISIVSCGGSRPNMPTTLSYYPQQNPYQITTPSSNTYIPSSDPYNTNNTIVNNGNISEIPPTDQQNQNPTNNNTNTTDNTNVTNPGDNNVIDNNNSGTTSTEPTRSTSDYGLVGSFKTDRDFFNQWQAKAIEVKNGTIYIAAIDTKFPSKGTVITMDSSSGENWKNLGKSLLKSVLTLGLAGYTISKNACGIAVDSNTNIFVLDTSKYIYTLQAPKYDIKKKQGDLIGGLDITATNNSIYIASSSGLKKYDSSLSSSTSINLQPTGGIGSDKNGNVYVVSGNKIKKVDKNGMVTDVVTGLNSPIDVAVNKSGDVFVLDSGEVKHFNNGILKGSFGGDSLVATSIAIDENDNVYVADFGQSDKDSKIDKYQFNSANTFITMSTNFVSTMNSPDVNIPIP